MQQAAFLKQQQQQAAMERQQQIQQQQRMQRGYAGAVSAHPSSRPIHPMRGAAVTAPAAMASRSSVPASYRPAAPALAAHRAKSTGGSNSFAQQRK